MSTIKDVAKMAGVSTALVSRCLNSDTGVGAEARERIENAVKSLNFHPNELARSLVTQKAHCIGVVLDNLCVPFLAPLISGLQQGAEAFDPEERYNLLFCSSDGDLERKQRHVRYLTQGRVDGIIIYGSMTHDDTIIEMLRRENFPFLLIENDIRDIEVDKVLIDNEDGAYQATKYLLQQGHRRIAHIAQDPLIRVSQDRYNGYCKALKEFHVPIDMDLVLWPEVSENESTEVDLRGGKIYYDAGYRAMKTLLQRGVRLDAIFFGGDLIAFGAQKAIAEVGIEVPSQLSLIGFDDEIPGYYNLTGKQITTMRQPLSEAGYLGVKALIKRLDNPSEPTQKLILKTKLIKRDSCMQIL